MALLSAKDAETIKRRFESDLVNPVEILLFTQKPSKLVVPGRQECLYCKETQELLEELVSLNSLLTLKVFDETDEISHRLYRVGMNEWPVIILHAPGDTEKLGVRFYGIPSGYEFGTLLEGLVDISKSTSRLSTASKDLAARIDKPIHLKVFVTPT